MFANTYKYKKNATQGLPWTFLNFRIMNISNLVKFKSEMEDKAFLPNESVFSKLNNQIKDMKNIVANKFITKWIFNILPSPNFSIHFTYQSIWLRPSDCIRVVKQDLFCRFSELQPKLIWDVLCALTFHCLKLSVSTLSAHDGLQSQSRRMLIAIEGN